MSSSSGTGSAIDIGAVLSQVVETYQKYLGVLVSAALIVFLPVAVLAAIFSNSGAGSLLVSIVSIVASFWFTGVVVKLVQDVQDGRLDASLGELFNSVTPVLFPLILLGIVAGIGIGIGFVLLIVPGLILITIWSVAAPALVLERTGVFESLGRSRALVRGNGWQVFGVIVAIFAITIVLAIIIGAIGAIGDSAVLRFIVQLVLNVLIAPVSALAASIIYFALLASHGEGRPATVGGMEPPVAPTPGDAPAQPQPLAPVPPAEGEDATDAFGNPVAAPEPPSQVPGGFEPPSPPSGPRPGGSIPPPSTPPPSAQ